MQRKEPAGMHWPLPHDVAMGQPYSALPKPSLQQWSVIPRLAQAEDVDDEVVGGGGELAGDEVPPSDGEEVESGSERVDADGEDEEVVPGAVDWQPSPPSLLQYVPQLYAITVPEEVRQAPQHPSVVLWGRVAGHEPVLGRLPVSSEGSASKFAGQEEHGEFWQVVPHV